MKKLFVFICLIAIHITTKAKPYIETVFAKNHQQFVRAKVINKTKYPLACYLAINGKKAKFTLPAFQHSRWYKATDVRFTPRDISTWCDYLDKHPAYSKYKNK